MKFLLLFVSLYSLVFGYDEANIVFAGDAMMHQKQIDCARQSDNTYDYSDYFTDIAPYISGADYAVVNLETAVSAPPYSGYPCFNAPESYVDALQNAGFDLFLTANNHTLDRNDRGLRATADNLDRRGLDHIGTYRTAAERDSVIPFVRSINNIKVGFLNYTYGTNGILPGKEVVVDYIDRDRIRRDVTATRDAGAEAIIVCIHWGDENRLLPNATQKDLAGFLKSLDVDVIIGGHPHVIQPVEMSVRKDGRPQLLYYSLGNFISNMTRRDNRGGMLASVTLRRGDDGRVTVSDASYRLVFTEQPTDNGTFRLEWADSSTWPAAKAFLDSAREIFTKHNKDVYEDIPDAENN